MWPFMFIPVVFISSISTSVTAMFIFVPSQYILSTSWLVPLTNVIPLSFTNVFGVISCVPYIFPLALILPDAVIAVAIKLVVVR